MPNNAQTPDQSNKRPFLLSGRKAGGGGVDAFVIRHPFRQDGQQSNEKLPKPPLKRQVGASSSNRQAAVGAGAGAVFLRCCWTPKFLSFFASWLASLFKKKEERKPPATKLNLNFGALARSCLTTPFASHMIAPSPRRRIGAAPLRELVERTLSNYSHFGVQFECMRS